MENRNLKLLDTITKGAALYLLVRTAYKIGKMVATIEIIDSVRNKHKKKDIYVEMEKES